MSSTTAPTFQVGRIYSTGEGRDYVWRFQVVSRTAKFITLRQTVGGETVRVGVKTQNWDGTNGEYAYPLGQYSMAPSIHADRPL